MKRGSLVNDISGKRNGRLTALRRSSRHSISGNYYWWFKCDCGGTIETLPSNVFKEKNGTKSCGCAAKSRHHGRRWLTAMIYDYKRHAEKLGVPYELTRTQFEDMCVLKCHYCGNENRGGIDRIDSTKGYVPENCVPCCKTCNYMKRSMTKEAFVEQCRKVVAMCVVASLR
jgi:hypothetical protein